MTAYPAWTPAPRPGIVPLHPLGFGTILGRSFTALRQNPKVLLGFALGVQAIVYVVIIAATAGVAFATFSRLATVPTGSDDYDAIFAGSIATVAITGIVLSLASGALGVIVQGVVVCEVTSAVVAEKNPLREIWRRVRPVAWRLLGYSFLVAFAALLVIGAIVAILFAIGTAVLPLAIIGGIFAFLAAIPLTLWLSTKLLLVPSTIILERATIRGAVIRSWRLTRGRFWSTLGILVIIQLTFGVVAQVISLPLSLFSSGLSTVFTPTGDPEAGAIIGLVVTTGLTQVLTILVQCVALIVQSTAAALVYVDCRMRHEGLDIDLQSYVERRDAGATDLADPYREHIGREIAPRPPMPGAFPPPPGYYPPGYAPAGYAPPGYPAPAYPSPRYAAPAGYPPPPNAGQAPAPSPSPAAPPVAPANPAAAPTAPPASDSPTTWAAPGDAS